MLKSRFLVRFILLLSLCLGTVSLQAGELFTPQNFPGFWVIQTNDDSSVTATEKAVHRFGKLAFSRVLELSAVPEDPTVVNPWAASDAEVHQFIAGYRPPPIPYTSPRTAKFTGREKFNCLEFAEDLVNKAKDSGIPAQVIGVRFQGRFTGHAIAGFPTADGNMLYFDSTPGNGQISHGAHQAHVQIGQPYSRSDGGELGGGAGQLPVSEIIPVTKLVEYAGSISTERTPSGTPMIWSVSNIKRIPAEGIDYANTNTLVVSDDQLARWKEAAKAWLAAEQDRKNHEQWAAQSSAAKAAARALAENQEQAARNDPFGQLRMGERYWNGDGVKKDPTLARAYLKQAADQGSPTAIEELKRITAESP